MKFRHLLMSYPFTNPLTPVPLPRVMILLFAELQMSLKAVVHNLVDAIHYFLESKLMRENLARAKEIAMVVGVCAVIVSYMCASPFCLLALCWGLKCCHLSRLVAVL